MTLSNKIIAALAIGLVIVIVLWTTDCRANAEIRAQLKLANEQAKADRLIADEAVSNLSKASIAANQVILAKDTQIAALQASGKDLQNALVANKAKTKKELESLNLDRDAVLSEYGKLEMNYNTAMTLLNNREEIIAEQRHEIVVLKAYKLQADATIEKMANAQESIEFANKACAKALSKKNRPGLRDLAMLAIGAGLSALSR